MIRKQKSIFDNLRKYRIGAMIDWNDINVYKYLEDRDLVLFSSYIYWIYASVECRFSDYTLDLFRNEIKWDIYLKNHIMYPNDIWKYISFLDWKVVKETQPIDSVFINYVEHTVAPKYKENSYWLLNRKEKHMNPERLSEIERFGKMINWSDRNIYKYMDESDVVLFSDYVNWVYVSSQTVISNNFMDTYADKVNWKLLAINKYLTEKQIEDHYENLNMEIIEKYQRPRAEFKNHMKKLYNDRNHVVSL